MRAVCVIRHPTAPFDHRQHNNWEQPVKKTLSVLATAALGVSMLAVPAFAAHEGTSYDANLSALNDSGASGTGSIQVSDDGESMTVQIDASGLAELNDGEGGQLGHAMHIHGIFEGDSLDAEPDSLFASSSCPDMSMDENGDGVLSVAEGAPAYGGVQVSLTTEGDTSADSALAVERFPVGTEIDYEREIDIPNAMKDSLGAVHFVIHGIDADGSGDLTDEDGRQSSLNPDLPIDATAPALCGTLTAASTGAVDTGAGGTATSTNGALVLGLGGLALAGALAFRRFGYSS